MRTTGFAAYRDAIAHGGGVQPIERVGRLEIEPGLLGSETSSSSLVSRCKMRWIRRLSKRSSVAASGALTGWNRGPFCSGV